MSVRFDYNIILFVLVLSCNSCAVLNKEETCIFQDGSEGKCKLMRECPIAQRLIKMGVFPVICGLDRLKSIVCCKDDEEVTKATNTTLANIPAISRTPGDISKQKCKEYAEYAYEKIPSPTLLLNPHITKRFVCEISRNRLVVGSSLAERREFPHMALITMKNVDGSYWECGGALISENFVLTVAHCLLSVKGGPATLVRVGFTNKLDPTHMQELTVSELIPYPEYDTSTGIYHDIGLLRLSTNVKFNTYVRPACLHTEKSISYVSSIASAWEALSYDTNLKNYLLAIVLKFYSLDGCNDVYRNRTRKVLKDGIIDDLMICADDTDLTICKEFHNGGPLQTYHKESEDVTCMYDIIGVASFRETCMTKSNLLHVFTRVSAYIKWIEDVVWPN